MTKLPRRMLLLATFILSSAVGGVSALEPDRELEAFIDVVRENPRTVGGAWLEMLNVFSEWEKVVLIFGFADPGDHAACQEILEFAAKQNPSRLYRCNPVE
jgi:hypothetical protein